MDLNVGILAIGNEVVEGQITNRNASWLSAELGELGANPLYHLSCRDNDQEISASLNFLTSHCQLIITSGGLGPTKDDFTRQSLSRWLNKPLVLDDSLWNEIKEKLTARKVTLRDGHKNQALIPEGALPLANRTGVAPGFFSESPNGFLASLPGPPRELNTMFAEQLAPVIMQQMNPKKSQHLQTWICLGAPESEVAHVVESIIGDSLEIGYRLHKPYVEVKLWLPENPTSDIQRRIEMMESKLKPWLVERSIENIRKRFHQKISHNDFVFVVDQLTTGLFLEKLKEGHTSDNLRYQCFENKSYRHFSETEVKAIIAHMSAEAGNNKLFIYLFPKSDHAAFICFNEKIITVDLPMRMPVNSQLGQLYIIEKCFLEFLNG